jgi:hypothetical protein
VAEPCLAGSTNSNRPASRSTCAKTAFSDSRSQASIRPAFAASFPDLMMVLVARVFRRRLNSHHDSPLVPFRRDDHATAQLHRPAQQAVVRMAQDVAVKPFLGFKPASKMLSQSGRSVTRPTNQPDADGVGGGHGLGCPMPPFV